MKFFDIYKKLVKDLAIIFRILKFISFKDRKKIISNCKVSLQVYVSSICNLRLFFNQRKCS